MTGFWVASWLHCPPQAYFSNGRRTVLAHLCFGPAESRTWFYRPDGSCFCEECIAEGLHSGECLLHPVSPPELRKLLENEAALCRRCGGERFIPLFQAELEKLNEP